MNNIDIDEIRESELQNYGNIFSCVYNLFGDCVGIFFKLIINGQEKVLQRRDDLFVLYSVVDENSVSYEMFTINEEYEVDTAGFDDFEMYTIGGDKVVKDRDSSNLESLVFMKRSDGKDADGYDGTVGYVQYNQDKDVRMMLIFQQMYNQMEKIYSYHMDKPPFQILIEKGVGAKQKGGLLPVREERYIRGDYDYRDNPTLYNLAVIKDYGLMEFMEKGAYALQKDNTITRYYKMLWKNEEGYAITTFPFGRQYRYEDFNEIFEKYGFKNRIPDHLISIHNKENEELNLYQEIATFMKAIEMEGPEEVIKLNLKFGGEDENGTNS